MLPPVRVKTCPDPRWGILAPFLAVLLIVGGTGIFVRVYHGSIEGDHKLDPAFPRAGRPFRIMIPPGSSGKKAATLLLVVTKESRSPYAPGRWPVPSTVMRLVLADSPDPRPVILSLDDPGLYQIRIIETSSGMSRLSRKVRVVLPASFLGDTLLLSTLALAGRRMAFQIGTKRRLMLILFLDLSALFVFGSLAEVPERRIEAIPLAFGNAPPTEGLLSLREQVWQGGPEHGIRSDTTGFFSRGRSSGEQRSRLRSFPFMSRVFFGPRWLSRAKEDRAFGFSGNLSGFGRTIRPKK